MSRWGKYVSVTMAAVILLASLGTMTPVRADGGCPTYTVLPGDTLISISMKFKVSLPDLLEANPSIKNVNNIWVGQQIVLPCRSKPQTDWEMLWEAVTNTPLSAYRLPGLGGTPKPKSLPLTFHYVQARESLWDIGGQYGASPFSIMDLNGLTGPDIFPGQPLIVPQGKPSTTPKLPQTIASDYLVKAYGKLPYAIPGKWGLPSIFWWMVTGGLMGSENPQIRLEKAYPPIPNRVGSWPEPQHVLDETLPRYRQRITCWRIAQREATQPDGQKPCRCGIRNNEDGTVSYMFYFCAGPRISTPLLTGGKWITDLLAIVNVGYSEGINMYNQSTAFTEPSEKTLQQFKPIPCPRFEDIIRMAQEATP